MPTFTYSPTDSVTIAPGGDVSIKNGATTTTFSKTGATKIVTKTPPDPNPPGLETPVSQKNKPNGDVIHTYSDITKTPPVTTRITFRPNGDVEILVTIGQDRNMVEINATTGVRRTKIWKDPDPEPEKWDKSETPKSGGMNGSAGNGSKNHKKPKRPVRKAARRRTPSRKRAAPRRPKKKAKRKARRR